VCVLRNSCHRFVEATKYISCGGIFDLAYFGSIKSHLTSIAIYSEILISRAFLRIIILLYQQIPSVAF
jgi:hypothetical protein